MVLRITPTRRRTECVVDHGACGLRFALKAAVEGSRLCEAAKSFSPLRSRADNRQPPVPLQGIGGSFTRLRWKIWVLGLRSRSDCFGEVTLHRLTPVGLHRYRQTKISLEPCRYRKRVFPIVVFAGRLVGGEMVEGEGVGEFPGVVQVIAGRAA